MQPRLGSTSSIWLVCVGIGLLFMARGAFQPYAFPLFEHLGALSYTQIALILNGYVLAQSVCAPFAGWFTDRTSVRTALTTSIVFGLCSFLAISTSPGFELSVIAVFTAGIAFVLGKIALNTILVLHSSTDVLRQSVAKRATLLNIGSFCGNSIAYHMTSRIGYGPHAVLLGLLHLPLAIGLMARPAPASACRKQIFGSESVKALVHSKSFLADSVRRFALVLPYGCWGTIIPKYVIDQYQSNDKVWVIYLTSVCTTVVGAHFLAVYLSAKLYRRGFRWEWWSMLSILLYCAGLLMLMFAIHPAILVLATVVFICGEVLMTPCFDETAKRHSTDAQMGTCMGLLHLVDGFGRMLGAAFALAVYGWIRTTSYQNWYWPIVVATFLLVCSGLHFLAFGIAGEHQRALSSAENAASMTNRDAMILSESESVV